MQGCLAPSEVPGVSSGDASIFGGIAEELIYADFCERYARVGTEVFRDANNPASYLLFLAANNPQFTQAVQTDFYRRLMTEQLMRIPDFMVHTATEKAFYEIKPDSPSGMTAGVEKVGILRAVYPFYKLPYIAGIVFMPRDHVVASYGSALRVTLRVRRAAEGLIVYKLCVDAQGVIELATLVLILRYIIGEMNRQKGSGRFRPVDLVPVFRRDRQLADLAKTLGLSFVAAGAAAVGWRFFWKAVVKRFAVRAAAGAVLAAADGPLPVGDLIAAGMAVWTIVDIIRLKDELWKDAAQIARQGA